RSSTSETPLAAACLTGESGAVEYFLHTCGADAGVVDNMGQTGLAIAAHHGHLAVVKLLLGFGGGVHVNRTRNLVNMTPLHLSAAFCHVLPTRLLLEAGGDENAVDIKGETPLDI
ncbi:unnamed protein product, partial [Laminaria digitata]